MPSHNLPLETCMEAGGAQEKPDTCLSVGPHCDNAQKIVKMKPGLLTD